MAQNNVSTVASPASPFLRCRPSIKPLMPNEIEDLIREAFEPWSPSGTSWKGMTSRVRNTWCLPCTSTAHGGAQQECPRLAEAPDLEELRAANRV